jgi:hypothetical protein
MNDEHKPINREERESGEEEEEEINGDGRAMSSRQARGEREGAFFSQGKVQESTSTSTLVAPSFDRFSRFFRHPERGEKDEPARARGVATSLPVLPSASATSRTFLVYPK